ncbi:MAG: DUF1667 domain-containing protein [Candidatus Tantalella remota]|nr:DUF1667 domain-containing protein [Candidatus Tantalella remota]
MKNQLTCIECPAGCAISVTIENGKVVKVEGNKCAKGEAYAITEIENPVRILTSTVLTKDMPLKMVPVKTSAPIPKGRMFEAMEEVKRVRVSGPLKVGETIIPDIAGTGVALVATRELTKS